MVVRHQPAATAFFKDVGCQCLELDRLAVINALSLEPLGTDNRRHVSVHPNMRIQ